MQRLIARHSLAGNTRVRARGCFRYRVFVAGDALPAFLRAASFFWRSRRS